MDYNPQTSTYSQMPENRSPSSAWSKPRLAGSKKIILIFLPMLFLVTLIIAIIINRLNSTKENIIDNQPQSNISPTPEIDKTPKLTNPELKFDNYVVATYPTKPSSVNRYQFNNLDVEEKIKATADILGLSKSSESETVVYSNTEDELNRGLLAVNKDKNSVYFQSFANHQLGSDQATFSDQAYSILENLGIADPTITCPITYNKQSVSDVIYVECHRSWENTGLPIYNPVGLLNLPESISITDLKVGYMPDDTYKDNEIINTSTNQDGLVRPTDFNSATFAFSTKDKRVILFQSNLRPILNAVAIEAEQLISPEEALDLIKIGKSSLSLVVPAGEGEVDWNIVFPNNLAQAKEANISDFVLAYFENFPEAKQQVLEPIYLIRGTAELNSGYKVRFIQVIPAIKNSSLSNEVLGETNYFAQKTIKLDTFTPTPSSGVSVTPGISTVTKSPAPTTPSNTNEPANPPSNSNTSSNIPSSLVNCPEKLEGAASYTIDVPGFGELTVARSHLRSVYYKGSSFDIANENILRDILIRRLKDQLIIDTAKYFQQYPEKLDEVKQANNPAAFLDKIVDYVDSLDMLVEPVRKSLTAEVMDLINNSQLSAWASKSDIFPKEFFKVFAGGDSLRQDITDCIITGISPSLYFYTTNSTYYNIVPKFRVTYSDPGLAINDWEVSTRLNSGIHTNDNIYHRRIYYEYDYRNTSFTESKYGIVVPYDSWKEGVEKIVQKLGLNETEKQDLLIDVSNLLLTKNKKQYLKISLAERSELDRELPISIFPNINFTRVHLMFTPLDYYLDILKPTIKPINRDQDTIIEIGVFYKLP